MADPFLIYGIDLSPYSVKVRSYFRYVKLPHEWIVRDMSQMEAFQKLAKLPLIPLVLTPEKNVMQDSTPIIEKIEATLDQPALSTGDETLDFISALLEEYSDEWGNKHMFHYRWWYEENQESAAKRIALTQLAASEETQKTKDFATFLKERMVPRLSFVGSNADTKNTIENSFKRLLTLLETHLATRPYLFGGKPVLADLGLACQLHQCYSDPYCQPIMKPFTKVIAWIEQLLDPTKQGEFESVDAIMPTLLPILEQEVAGLFLPWSTANAAALEQGTAELSVELNGETFKQQPQKYHARSLGALKKKYSDVASNSQLNSILEQTNCLQFLK